MSKKNDDDILKEGERGPRFYASQEEQDLARLKEAVNRTDEEKFFFLMQLMKVQQNLKQGTIKHIKA